MDQWSSLNKNQKKKKCTGKKEMTSFFKYLKEGNFFI